MRRNHMNADIQANITSSQATKLKWKVTKFQKLMEVLVLLLVSSSQQLNCHHDVSYIRDFVLWMNLNIEMAFIVKIQDCLCNSVHCQVGTSKQMNASFRHRRCFLCKGKKYPALLQHLSCPSLLMVLPSWLIDAGGILVFPSWVVCFLFRSQSWRP